MQYYFNSCISCFKCQESRLSSLKLISWNRTHNSWNSLIRTPKGQSEVSLLERCLYKRGHYDDVTFTTRSIYVKHHVKNVWKMSYFHTLFTRFSHTFHLHFTHIFHVHVKFCIVKYTSMWKGCEVTSSLSHIFSHTLHMGFHTGFHM